METPLQQQIEQLVTDNRGYKPRTPFSISSSHLQTIELGLQLTLGQMDVLDQKVNDSYDFIWLAGKNMQRKYELVGIPLSVITTPEGFVKAIHAAFHEPSVEALTAAFPQIDYRAYLERLIKHYNHLFDNKIENFFPIDRRIKVKKNFPSYINYMNII